MDKLDKNKFAIFGLDGAYELAKNTAKNLEMTLSAINIKNFSDGEMYISLLESVRNKTCYVIQSTCKPVNYNLMELMILVDALKRDSAREIIAIVPYFGYARQDRRNGKREPITARLVSDLLVTSGVTKILLIDIHTDQIEGFFSIPSDNLTVIRILINDYINDLKIKNNSKSIDWSNFVLVSPDYGGVKRIRTIADEMHLNVAIVDKKRTDTDQVEIENVLGEVNNKNCIIVDDIIDTAGTMVGACKLIKNKGAKTVTVIATHPVLTGKAFERISEALNQHWIDSIYVSDTVVLSEEFKAFSNIKVVNLDQFLAKIIYANETNASFDDVGKKL